MSTYTAEVRWTLAPGGDFARGHYSRGHTIGFDGGVTLAASASPHVVGRWAVEAAVDPEEMLVAALSSCHMLSFLHVARETGFVVAAYDDRAKGVMEAIGGERMAVTKVVLRPTIRWAGPAPTPTEIDLMHRAAHEACFIANSVKTEVTVEQRPISQPIAEEQCELWLRNEWVPISLERALTLDKDRRKRCIECGGQVRVHKLGSTGQRAHFEHMRAHEGCSLGSNFSGVRSLHPKALK